MGNLIHEHIEPSLRVHWGQWACAQCTPVYYDILLSSDPRDKTPATQMCPFCREHNDYAKGFFRDHRDDGERCRASGLTVQVATVMLDATLSGRGVESLMADVKRRAATGWGQQVVKPVGRYFKKTDATRVAVILTELRAQRLRRGWSQTQVGELLNTSDVAICNWENGQKSPGMGSSIAWSAVFGGELHLVDHCSGQREVLVNSEVGRLALVRRRKENGTYEKDAALKMGLSWAGLQKRERTSSYHLRLADFHAWAKLLEFDIQLVVTA